MYVVGLSLVLSLTPFPDIPIWDPWVGTGSGFRCLCTPFLSLGVNFHFWLLSSQETASLTGPWQEDRHWIVLRQISCPHKLFSSLSAVEDSSRKPKIHLSTELTAAPHCCTPANLTTITDITRLQTWDHSSTVKAFLIQQIPNKVVDAAFHWPALDWTSPAESWHCLG